MKRILISAGLATAALAASTGAQAAGGLTPAQTAAATTQFFLSGATAPLSTIRQTVKSLVCGGTWSEYIDASSPKFVAIGCNSPVTGGTLAFYFTSVGSNFGVQPVIFNKTGAATPRLNLATCAAQASNADQTCAGATSPAASTIPDAGVSDIDPRGFVLNNVPSLAVLKAEFDPTFTNAFSGTPGGVADYAALVAAMQAPVKGTDLTAPTEVNPSYALPFAIAISNPLATALGGAANSIPLGVGSAQSLSKATVSAILGGSLVSASQILTAVGATDNGQTTKFAICSRPATSGTKAWSNIFFLGTGAPRAQNFNAAIPTSGANWGGQSVAVVNNVTSGDVRNCLIQASAQGIPAIGIISRENGNEPNAVNSGVANTFSYARLDGVFADNAASGDRVNVRSGAYTYVGEATFQTRGGLSANKQAVLDALTGDLGGGAACIAPINSRAITTLPDGTNGNATGCEMRWSRSGDPFAVPLAAE